METVPIALQENSGTNADTIKRDNSSPQQGNGRDSPPPNCAICLGICRNKSFTDSCLHQFCFNCLVTWSKVKAECPLCKQNFKSIIHNVQSNHQYEEYLVEQHHTEETAERIDIDSLTTTTRRFRYRTTLTLPRRESIAIQRLLMQYPMMGEVYPPPTRPPPPLQPRRRHSPVSFRRTVYRHNLWARPLPDCTGRYRDCSPEFYRYNYTQTQRLVPWINRELKYLLNHSEGHIVYVITRILELLPQCHINSAEFREALQRYIGDRTEHFLHELYCFASTPYDMTGYDRYVQYTTDARVSTMINEVISSSESEASVDSDIVMVTTSEPAGPPAGPSRLPPPLPPPPTAPMPTYPQSYIPQPPTDNVIPIETISHSDTDDDSSEVMVVGYIKPPQDRTPEIVDLLGSDSDVIMQDTQPESSLALNDVQEIPPAQSQNLVKLSLKRHAPQDNLKQYSDSEDSSYTPPIRNRKRRRHSNNSATTSYTYRSTPSPTTPSPSPTPSPSTTSSRWSTDSYESSTDTGNSSSSSSYKKKKTTKRKARRKVYTKLKTPTEEKEKKKHKRTPCKNKRNARTSRSERDKAKNTKRKSKTGKGVKSSKKSTSQLNAHLNCQKIDEPSTSGMGESSTLSAPEKTRRYQHSDSESRRLRSVVVMNNQKNSDSSSSVNSNLLNILSSAILNPKSAYNSDSGSTVGEDRTSSVPPEVLQKAESCFNIPLPPDRSDFSDSEDDLPLNLTTNKMADYEREVHATYRERHKTLPAASRHTPSYWQIKSDELVTIMKLDIYYNVIQDI